MKRRFLQSGLAFAAMIAAMAAAVPAQADDYPTRPITILVPFPPGGSSDIVMRLVASKASEALKQPIVIENRPGAAGNVAAMAIKNAPPDGYLLMMGHTGTHAINATLYTDLKFDPVKDFAPITGARLVQQHPECPGVESGQNASRAGRPCQDQARGPELRLAGRRHRRASARRAVCQACGRQSRSCALSRHRAGGDRHGRGPDGSVVRRLSLQRRACGGGAAAAARHRRRETASAPPRSADHGRGRLSRGADGAMVRPVRAGEDARRRSCRSSTRNSSRRCAATRCATRCCRRSSRCCRPRRTSLARLSCATSPASGRW